MSQTQHEFIKFERQNVLRNNLNKECSQAAHKKLKLDFSKTQECVEKSFSDKLEKNWLKAETTNKIIDSEISYMYEYGAYHFPSIVINNKTYRG